MARSEISAFVAQRLLLLAAALLSTSSSIATAAPGIVAANGDAASLVRRALEAEAAGQPEIRTRHLEQARQTAPDYPPLHWQIGEIRVGGHWVASDDAAQQAKFAAKVAEYERRRDEATDSYVDQLNLAHFCARIGLPEQERFHLANVLKQRPNSPEATRNLGLVLYERRYVPAAQLDRILRDAHSKRNETREWEARLSRWKNNLDHGSEVVREATLAEIGSTRDPKGIRACELFTLTASADAGKAVISALAQMPEQAATDSLVRHAIIAPYEEVRQAASTALRPRSVYSYMPMLLSYVHAADDREFQIFLIGDRRQVPALPAEMGDAAFAQRRPAGVFALLDRDRTERNSRVAAALKVAVGEDLPADAQEIWDWWATYNELYISPDGGHDALKITSLTPRPDEPELMMPRYLTPPPQPKPRRRHSHYQSCFVAGTPVATLIGQQPIETIKPGDCVLSQNVETGELAYKAVVTTTVRPPSPLVEVHLGSTTIRATRGHPFWVSGLGWQMAKELQVGKWLHTASGAAQITELTSAPDEQCYNLVVADNGNYFVSDARVLVHDNNIRDVTTATVPGLLP